MSKRVSSSVGAESTTVAAAVQASSLLALLKKVFHTLESIGRAINRVVGRILVFLVYVLAIGPLALIVRVTGKSLLESVPVPKSGSLWLKRAHPENDGLAQGRRQF